MISFYQSGRMKIGDTEYENDLKIVSGRVRPEWWRKNGHRLVPEDIADILSAGPETLVVGTGYAQNLRITDEARRVIESSGIALIARETSEAVDIFNRIHKAENSVAGAFHLTC